MIRPFVSVLQVSFFRASNNCHLVLKAFSPRMSTGIFFDSDGWTIAAWDLSCRAPAVFGIRFFISRIAARRHLPVAIWRLES